MLQHRWICCKAGMLCLCCDWSLCQPVWRKVAENKYNWPAHEYCGNFHWPYIGLFDSNPRFHSIPLCLFFVVEQRRNSHLHSISFSPFQSLSAVAPQNGLDTWAHLVISTDVTCNILISGEFFLLWIYPTSVIPGFWQAIYSPICDL
jgi:hypothetical protein